MVEKHNNERNKTVMGDRGNIVVRQGDTNRDDVWFYGHSSGYRLHETVAKALGKHWRWGDHSYLARIIFDEWCDERGHECGFGISCSIGDNEHPILVVDCPNQQVYEVPAKDLVDGRLPDKPKPVKSWGFEVFIALTTEKTAA